MEDHVEPLTISVEDDASREDLACIRDGVDNYNIQVTGDPRFNPVNVLLRRADGTVAGGALGDLWAEWMHLTFLWVAEEHRRGGYGTLLLAEAERQAIAWGCRGVYLETFSFQARP